MTRPYSHRPDVADAGAWYTRAAGEVDRAVDDVARGRTVEIRDVGLALDDLWDALAWGWLTQRPLEELAALVGPAAELVVAWLDAPHGRPVRLRDVELLVATALLAGDGDAARRTAALDVPPPSQDVEWRAAALTGLVRQDDVAADAAVDRLRSIVAAPTTAPVVASWLAHLDELSDAVIRRDQAAFGAALRARAHAVARLHRTAVTRRRSSGLLDWTAIALARVGEQRGLVVPPGVEVVPAELLAAVGSVGRAGSAARRSRARRRWWPGARSGVRPG
ncbi:hypothetical protein [Cellulomonas xiejunii]|uniref:hypothetical protein n=1 Tax=Cellulomonas xiejunii TaxID=2968083 RepID=UPI001D0E1B09|nr:hypothetical protein [Cellulomonas xiejunii]MCC2312770.1 hypothetical protein [Cellulomonas xiejunii]